jgi:hypothetical protein
MSEAGHLRLFGDVRYEFGMPPKSDISLFIQSSVFSNGELSHCMLPLSFLKLK